MLSELEDLPSMCCYISVNGNKASNKCWFDLVTSPPVKKGNNFPLYTFSRRVRHCTTRKHIGDNFLG